MEFITMVHPSQKGSAHLKRQAHSHAARVAHARARRLRMAEYKHESNENPGHQIQTSTNYQQQSSSRRELGPSIPETIPGAFEHEPLASFLASLTSREHFMFSHYVQVVAPNMKTHCPLMTYLGGRHSYVKNNWILVSSTNIDFLRGFLLAACRDLSMMSSKTEYSELAIQYKLTYVQNLREAMLCGDQVSRQTAVTRALVLAFDEIMVRDLSMASKHVLGAVHIIREAGGVQALGLSELVICILYSCMYGKGLLDLDLELESIWA
ncbi:hypothetical protein B0T10DRAFT_581623 [Thelonectria olida]|uniref:Uncharacterized protein n=1 Tax=Thelonectria olida TaxID=1576542 RepID=A0A9P9AN35_9HYPO|nr:hypothetical protein B0T10DRAFT_581623 [Thelonectria olida]